jgi:hypothetical protein
MQVAGDHGVERLRPQDDAHGHGVHQHLVPGHVGEFARHRGCDLVPNHHGVALGVRLGDDRQQLARPRPRQREGEAHDAVAPARVITETSVATSSGIPRCTRPPTPAYSPSLFSRTITQSSSFAVTPRKGLATPVGCAPAIAIRCPPQVGAVTSRLPWQTEAMCQLQSCEYCPAMDFITAVR